MNAERPTPSLRFEVKFVFAPTRLAWIEDWIGRHAAVFFEPFPPRQVSNVYFDTFDLWTYRENLSGSSSRSKVRFRWYGETNRAERGALEIKRRVRNLGWKLAYRAGPLGLEGARWRDLQRALRGQLPREGRVWLDEHALPVLINRYRRRYFESVDRRVRLTIDWKQRVYDQRLRPVPNFTRAANLPDTMVVEFKFAAEDRRLASEVLQTFPIRVSRNSKYVIGVQAIERG
jgi:hypothetical protein